MKKLLVLIYVIVFFLGAYCCKKESKMTFKAKETPDLLAQINGNPLYEKDLDLRSRTTLFDIKKQIVENYLKEKLTNEYMKKKGYTQNELFEKEIKGKVKTPTEKEIKDFYNERGIKQPFETARKNIEDYLQRQKFTDRQKKFYSDLTKGNEIVYYFTRPRAEISLNPDDITRGSKDAPVILVEYTDFQCPFCGRSQKTVEDLLKKYSQKLKHVFRHFPLPMHTLARDASNAAYCANEQNMFWQYHDLLFSKQQEINKENLVKWASDLKMDTDKFKKCLEGKNYDKLIQRDLDSGQTLGISSTPAFFINGIVISGAQPISIFEGVIEEELKNTGRKSN